MTRVGSGASSATGAFGCCVDVYGALQCLRGKRGFTCVGKGIGVWEEGIEGYLALDTRNTHLVSSLLLLIERI